MLKGIDVSGYDGKNLNFSKIRGLFDFVIIKCGGQEDAGYSVYRHGAYTTHIANAKASGISRIGHYWFNGIGATPRIGAEAFANFAQSEDKDILVLDCEGYQWSGISKPQWTPAECLVFFQRLKELKPHNTLYLYINRSTENSLNWSAIVAMGVKLWVADYGTSSKPAGTQGAEPRIVHWKQWDIWQYDSRGGGNGINSAIGSSRAGTVNLDVNTAKDNAFGQGETTYQTHVQNVGDSPVASDDEMSGTTGHGLRMEGVIFHGHFKYRAHVQNIGWMDFVRDVWTGTKNKALRLEAIEFVADDGYEVIAQAHVANIGWQPIQRGKQITIGTVNKALAIEAIKVSTVKV